MNNIEWRRILISGVGVGLIAGVIPMFFGAELLYTTMPIAMMISAYLLIPRVESKRFWNGFLVSALTAVVAVVIYFVYMYARFGGETATPSLKAALTQLPLLILMISLFGSWLFAKTHEWSLKKREELEAKRAARKEQRRNMHRSRGTKKKYKKKKKK
jgi:type VI protein secretion system component VasK